MHALAAASPCPTLTHCPPRRGGGNPAPVAVPANEKYFVSAAADSVVTFWEDCTEFQEEEKLAAKTELVLKYASHHTSFENN